MRLSAHCMHLAAPPVREIENFAHQGVPHDARKMRECVVPPAPCGRPQPLPALVQSLCAQAGDRGGAAEGRGLNVTLAASASHLPPPWLCACAGAAISAVYEGCGYVGCVHVLRAPALAC